MTNEPELVVVTDMKDPEHPTTEELAAGKKVQGLHLAGIAYGTHPASGEEIPVEAGLDGPVLDRYKIHYKGNLVGKIEGQIVGPNEMGEYFTIRRTSYDPETDRTTARVHFTTQHDMRAIYDGKVEGYE